MFVHILIPGPCSGKTVISILVTDYSKEKILGSPLLWPRGVVEFEFHSNFPPEHREIMVEVMRYIEEKVPCINFTEKTETTIDYVLIYPGGSIHPCSSSLGRIGGGVQRLNLNRCVSIT